MISYKTPAYTLHGEVVLYFAGWTHHYSLYPAGASLVMMIRSQWVFISRSFARGISHHSPGLLCIMPPSVIMVVAVM